MKGNLRIFTVFLVLCLAVSSTVGPRYRVRAVPLFAVPIAWELLQSLLISAGLTVAVADWLDRMDGAACRDAYDRAVQELDRIDPGLGAALDGAVSAAERLDAGWRCSLDPVTWGRLLAASAQVAAGGASLELGSTTVPVEVATPEGIVSATMEAVPEGLLPINSRTGARGRYSSYQSASWDGWDAFAALAGGGTGALVVSTIYGVYENGSGAITYFIAAQDGAPISSASISEDGLYLSVYGQDGTPLPFAIGSSSLSGDTWNPLAFYGGGFVTSYRLPGTRPYYVTGLLNNAMVLPVAARVDPAVLPAIAAGAYDVVTVGRSLTELGQLAGALTITLPDSLDLGKELGDVAAGTKPLTDVLPKVGVTPVDLAADKVIGKDATIADSVDAAAAPAVGSFDMGLTGVFPFCIPFDFVRFLGLFRAEPEAPSFTFRFPTGFGKGGTTYTDYELDLSQFDGVAYWCRKLELVAFIVGLMFLTRSVFIRS